MDRRRRCRRGLSLSVLLPPPPPPLPPMSTMTTTTTTTSLLLLLLPLCSAFLRRMRCGTLFAIRSCFHISVAWLGHGLQKYVVNIQEHALLFGNAQPDTIRTETESIAATPEPHAETRLHSATRSPTRHLSPSTLRSLGHRDYPSQANTHLPFQHRVVFIIH
jgi:hypothetical protein